MIQNFNHIRLTDVSSPAAPCNRHSSEIALLNGTAILLENGAGVSLKNVTGVSWLYQRRR